MKDEKKQTAVEWYSNKLFEILGDMCNEFTQEQTLANHYALKQAKEMEKKRIENTWIAALDYGIEKMKGLNVLESKDAFETFYNETYGGNNE